MPVLAIGGIALVAFVVALAALLMLLAGHIFHRVTAGIFAKIPRVGGVLADGISLFLGSVTAALNPLYDRIVHPVAHWLWAYALGPWHLAWNVVRSIGDAKTWAVNAYQRAVSAEQAAEAYADHAISTAVGAVEGEISGVYQNVAQDLGDVYATMALDLAAAEGYADGLFHTATADIGSAIRTAEGYADGLLGAAEGYALGLYDDVHNEAVRLFGQAEAAIGTIAGEIAAMPGEIAGQIDTTVPGMIDAALAAAGVAAIPALLTEVSALATEADTCLKPLCETVTPNAKKLGNLGHGLQGLEDLAVVALIVGLVEAALHDPVGVADGMNTVIEDVASPVFTGVKDLLGL